MRSHLFRASLLVLAFAASAGAWRARIVGDPGMSASVEALGIFANGDVMAVGSAQHAATSEDFLAMRFQSRTGRVLWRLELDGIVAGGFQSATDGGWELAVARNGDVFVGGSLCGPGGDGDATVIRLHGRSGRERWRTSFSLADSLRWDLVRQVLAHPSGDAVAIVYLGSDTAFDVVRALRLDGRNGAVRWQRDVSVGGCTHDCGALDAAGNLVMAGRDYDFVAGRFVARAASFDGETGATRWTSQVFGVNAHSFAYGSDGAVVVGGIDDEGGGGVVVRLDPRGAPSWRYAFAGTDAYVSRVDVAADGAVLAGGLVDGETFATRLDPATGGVRWRTTLRRAPGFGALAWPVVLAFADDRRGGVIATVPPNQSSEDPQGMMLSLDGTTGAERWRAAVGADVLTTLARGGHGFVVGAGLTSDDPVGPFEAAVVTRDGRRGTDVQGAKPHGPSGHVPPGHRVP